MAIEKLELSGKVLRVGDQIWYFDEGGTLQSPPIVGILEPGIGEASPRVAVFDAGGRLVSVPSWNTYPTRESAISGQAFEVNHQHQLALERLGKTEVALKRFIESYGSEAGLFHPEERP